MELKIAAIKSLDYDDFWRVIRPLPPLLYIHIDHTLKQLFGEGRHPSFRTLLDGKIAPHLSAHAYAFWKTNASAFDDRFYREGYSG